MIDFIKFKLVNSNVEQLESNPFLEFKMLVNADTGEYSRLKNAYYKGLKFTIIEPTDKYPDWGITVEGSLHKYWNNGMHNFNDFKAEDIWEVLQELEEKFGILPKNCVLRQLELGVNINHPYDTKTILKSCIMHKTTPFKSMYVSDEGNYIQAWHQRYILKIYDKRKHYAKKGFDIDSKILRFEIKYTKMQFLHKIGVYSLEDLITWRLHLFKLRLVFEWSNVLFYDFEVYDGTAWEHKYGNPNFWGQLNYEQLKYHRNKLKKKAEEDPDNLKGHIEALIEDKAEYLCPSIPCMIGIK